MTEIDARGRLLAHAYWEELEKIALSAGLAERAAEKARQSFGSMVHHPFYGHNSELMTAASRRGQQAATFADYAAKGPKAVRAPLRSRASAAVTRDVEDVVKTSSAAQAFEAVGGFLRGQATRVAGKAAETGVEQTAQGFARDAAGKVLRGRRTFAAMGENATLGQHAKAFGATALDWAGHNPRSAAAIAGGGLLAAGAAPGFVAGRATS